MSPRVTAVHSAAGHHFSKTTQTAIKLVAGFGVEDDGHFGKTVQHRSRIKQNPNQINLRQVHVIHSELFDELITKGFKVAAGQLGENITTANLDLLTLPTDTLLKMGDTVVIRVTGLRNPCVQIDNFQPGLMAALLDKDGRGNVIRKAGIMAVVVNGGTIKPQQPIAVELPPEPHQPLRPV